MAILVEAPNLSEAWVLAMEQLMAFGGTAVNLITVIGSSDCEKRAIRQGLDEFLRASGTWPVITVANTIFPNSLYIPRLEDQARKHLYEMHEEGRQIRRRLPANQKGTYFDRLIAWPGKDGPVNQLERVINRLNSGSKLTSAYELGLTAPETDSVGTTEFRIQHPRLDTSVMGFPCLSHISLTAQSDVLHMTATYRNQHFVRKAYGNFVGLSSLLQFLAHETGRRPGELVCVATHADAEMGRRKGFGKRAITALIAASRERMTTLPIDGATRLAG